jgi:apolipoprotein N-acyltransferase
MRSSVAPMAAVLLLTLLLGSIRLAFFDPTAPTVRVAALAADRALWHGLSVFGGRALATADDDVRAAARAQYEPVIDDLIERTHIQARAGAQIVSWSETAAFVLKEDEAALMNRARALARDERIYLQLGLIAQLRTEHHPFRGEPRHSDRLVGEGRAGLPQGGPPAR